ncbi:hypothetical protein HYFRA_00005966 [Hymenoscyphus fraxineus]|uniref:BTB domain-containing protein n=1 Tax=Hymenoscyphus fraxineus TaxID=746836 RepID=A0A9N9KZK3_9HELO|nr:hypothetical protein HYFRA_00005966 [Hymenoscyphus fraxineus]
MSHYTSFGVPLSGGQGPSRGGRRGGLAFRPGRVQNGSRAEGAPKVAVKWDIEVSAATTAPTASESYMDKLGTEMVDIYVGPEKKLFRIHKKPLCERIPHFKRTFEGEFKEADEGVSILEDVNADAFDKLIDMVVYHGNIKSLGAESAMAYDPVELYVLADRYLVPNVCDRIMDRLIERHQRCKELPSVEFAKSVYTKTPHGCKLREYCLLAMKFVYCPKAKLAGYEASWPIEALREFQETILDFHDDFTRIAREDPQDPRYIDKKSKCRYHLHEGGLVCSENKTRHAMRAGKHAEKAQKRRASDGNSPAPRVWGDDNGSAAATGGAW